MSENSSGVESGIAKKKGLFSFLDRFHAKKEEVETSQNPINPEDVAFEQKKQEDLKKRVQQMVQEENIGKIRKLPTPPQEEKIPQE